MKITKFDKRLGWNNVKNLKFSFKKRPKMALFRPQKTTVKNKGQPNLVNAKRSLGLLPLAGSTHVPALPSTSCVKPSQASSDAVPDFLTISYNP